MLDLSVALILVGSVLVIVGLVLSGIHGGLVTVHKRNKIKFY